jgi:hypothetical protein
MADRTFTLQPSGDAKATALAIAAHLVASEEVSRGVAGQVKGKPDADLAAVRLRADLVRELSDRMLGLHQEKY